MDLTLLGQQAQASARKLALLDTKEKNRLLGAMAQALITATPEILAANEKDLAQAVANGISETMQDRLRLTKERIAEA